MPRDPLIALVGKPSSGKSTTLNSLTDTTAKVGNFPFTTIDPNRAVGYLHIPCACSRPTLPGNTPASPSDPPPLQARCKPNYGACQSGVRSVPIELLDVAGLVPGAHQGKGLGNKFLDDLRHADALIHVVDVSGCTDAEGKATRGYDPSQDIIWLRSEIVSWVLGNLMQKWGGVKRRHIAVKATAVETLQNQFSGYGSNSAIVARTLDKMLLKQPLQDWSDDTISAVVHAFVDEKFPTVIALNKIDHPDADKNVAKIAKMEKPERLVLCSAISEVFLRRLVKQGFVRYIPGSEFVDTREDLLEQGESDGGGLKEMDEKLKTRVENLRDMVLYRFGSTGVNQVLTRASETLGLVPVFPVKNIGSFGGGEAGGGGRAGEGGGGERAPVFRDCVLVKKSSTVGDVYRKVMGDAPLAYVETVGGVRVSEDDEVGVGKNDLELRMPITPPLDGPLARSRSMSMSMHVLPVADEDEQEMVSPISVWKPAGWRRVGHDGLGEPGFSPKPNYQNGVSVVRSSSSHVGTIIGEVVAHAARSLASSDAAALLDEADWKTPTQGDFVLTPGPNQRPLQKNEDTRLATGDSAGTSAAGEPSARATELFNAAGVDGDVDDEHDEVWREMGMSTNSTRSSEKTQKH
ncbi:hypothetical protein LTR85_001326 [Meristemomyces frigidus]|nr:hypothetical protein LTR85_001326 [Meristemomyces frigidus]